MGRRPAIFLSTALAMSVGLAAYLYGERSAPALALAARNTARFSGFVFALALLARSPRFTSLFAARWPLFWAFIAAHGVHFGAVLAVVFLDASHPLHQLNLKVAVTLAGGFGIVLAAAMTAGRADHPFGSRVHTFFFYLVAVLFLVAFASGVRTNHPLSIFNLVALVLALLARALPAKRAVRASA